MAPVASRLAGGAPPGTIRFRRFLSKYGLSVTAVANAVVVEAHAKRLARTLKEIIEDQQRSGGTVVKHEAGQADTAEAAAIFGLPGTDIISKAITVPHSWTLRSSSPYVVPFDAETKMSFVGKIDTITRGGGSPPECVWVRVKLGWGDANVMVFFVPSHTKLYRYVAEKMVFEADSLIYVKDLVPTHFDNADVLQFTLDSTIKLIRPDKTSFDDISRFNARLNAEWSGLDIDTLEFEEDKDDDSDDSGHDTDDLEVVPKKTPRTHSLRRVRFSP